MSRAGYRIGFLAVALLVVLRIAIGWHFLYEGMWKYKNPSFSAEGFLKQARGPWAEKFHDLVPDYDGRQRLDAPKMLERWDDHRRLLARTLQLQRGAIGRGGPHLRSLSEAA